MKYINTQTTQHHITSHLKKNKRTNKINIIYIYNTYLSIITFEKYSILSLDVKEQK